MRDRRRRRFVTPPTRDLLEATRRDRRQLDILVMFVLAAFVGFEVISKVPSILHTPLMSGSNAIHGIILVGAMIVAERPTGRCRSSWRWSAMILATVNIVGGMVVTDRMLEMFKGRDPAPPARAARREPARRRTTRAAGA